MMSAGPASELHHKRLWFTVMCLGCGLVLLTVLLLSLGLWRDYDRSQQAAANLTSGLTAALREHTARLVGAVELALRSVDEDPTTAELTPPVNLLATHARLKHTVSVSPFLEGLALVDAAGDFVVDFDSPTGRAINVADREAFYVHRDDPNLGLFIARPQQNRRTGNWIASVSMRLNGPHGRFAGIVSGSIKPAYFREFFHNLDIGADGAIELLRDDGVLIAREPVAEAMRHGHLGVGELFTQHLAKAPAGTFQGRSAVDGVDRVTSYATVSPYPLVVAVSMSKEQALAEWSRQVWRYGAACAALILLYVATTFVILRWLSLWKASDLQLRAAKEAAEDASSAKSSFLAHVSHELRTPLNAIIGFSDVMVNEVFGKHTTPRYREYAGDIRASGEHLLALINDLLDLSKVAAGKWVLHEELVSVKEVVGAVFRMVEFKAQRGGVRLIDDVPADFPHLLVDQRVLFQVLLNLVTNAVKFTLSGGEVRVAIGREHGGRVILRVVDTGVGMTEEDAQRVVIPFGHVRSDVRRKNQDTGLGLPLSKAFVELHGGSLEIESKVDLGTTIIVSLPPHRLRQAA